MITFNYQTAFTFKDRKKVKQWIADCVSVFNYEINHIDFVFCDNKFIHAINKEHLGHDYVTDIITFDYSKDNQLTAEIYIAPQHVRDNAIDYNVSFKDELHRVMIHGILHITGYNDQSPEQKAEMRHKEDYLLSLRAF